MWRLTAHQLNQVEVKLPDVTISGDGICRDNGKWFKEEMQKHPINALEVNDVTFDASYFRGNWSVDCQRLSNIYNMRSLATDASLQRLRIENCQNDGFYLPQTLTDVTLINASSENVPWQLPNLRNVEVDSHEVAWLG